MPQDTNNPALYTWPLPHLRSDAPFVNLPLIDENNKLFYWIKNNDRTFINIKPVAIEQNYYFSNNKNLIDDAYFPFIEFCIQKVQTLNNFSFLHQIQDEIANLLVSLAKIDFFHKNDILPLTDRISFFGTEIRYIFTTARSLFDALQLGICQFFNKQKWVESKEKTITINNLPESFANMYKQDAQRHLIDVSANHNIPPFLIEFYKNQKSFFEFIRSFRDQIIHDGKTVDYIFHITNKGFGLSLSHHKPNDLLQLCKNQNVWNEKSFQPNQIAPALPILAYCIFNTIEATNNLTFILKNPNYYKGFPPDVAPGYHIYWRSPYSKYYNVLRTIISENIWSF